MHQTPLWRILDRARWAPSGDNTQPWRFEIVGSDHAVVHGFDTRDHCVYDLDGHPSQISLGALLETAAIAASAEGYQLDIRRRDDMPETRPTFDLHLRPRPDAASDPLAPFIETRSVQRRPLQMRPLTTQQKQQLENQLPTGFSIQWIEGSASKLRTAMLMFRSAHIRLTIPEAYEVHREIIEWDCSHSETKVPDQALGVDAMTSRLMRFVMQSWPRVQFFNRFLAGTWAPRLQMDFWPSLACAAHFALQGPKTPNCIDDYVAAGRAVQRLWLGATALGLQLQPEVTPLVFARYARESRSFSVKPGATPEARRVQERLEALLGGDTAASRCVYMGRLGFGAPPAARSLRLPLEKLLVEGTET